MARRGREKGPNGWKYHSRTRRTKLPICLGRFFLFSDSLLLSFSTFLPSFFNVFYHSSSFFRRPLGPPTPLFPRPTFFSSRDIANNFRNSRLESFPYEPAREETGSSFLFAKPFFLFSVFSSSFRIENACENRPMTMVIPTIYSYPRYSYSSIGLVV